VILDILTCSGDIRDQSLRLYKIDKNLACFGPNFFFLGGGGGVVPPEFLDLHSASFRLCGKFSRRSAEGARRYGGEINKRRAVAVQTARAKPL